MYKGNMSLGELMQIRIYRGEYITYFIETIRRIIRKEDRMQNDQAPASVISNIEKAAKSNINATCIKKVGATL